jgi:hypothetical protein
MDILPAAGLLSINRRRAGSWIDRGLEYWRVPCSSVRDGMRGVNKMEHGDREPDPMGVRSRMYMCTRAFDGQSAELRMCCGPTNGYVTVRRPPHPAHTPRRCAPRRQTRRPSPRCSASHSPRTSLQRPTTSPQPLIPFPEEHNPHDPHAAISFRVARLLRSRFGSLDREHPFGPAPPTTPPPRASAPYTPIRGSSTGSPVG